jgi:hypothetical protein
MSQQHNEICYQNTFGCEPWAVGRVIAHPSLLAVTYLIGGGVLAANLGWFIAPLVLVAAANDWKAASKPSTPKAPKRLYAWASDGPALPPAKDSSDGIGAETRLNAIDVQAAQDLTQYGGDNPFAAHDTPGIPVRTHTGPIITPPPVYTEPKVSEYEPGPAPTDWEMEPLPSTPTGQPPKPLTPPSVTLSSVADELVALEDGNLRSWFITGASGAGKGTLATFALMLANNKIPGVSLWGIDPKADPREYKRWAIIPTGQRYHFDAANPNLDSSARKRIDEGIKDLIDRFYTDPSPHKILWVDELPAIVAALTPSYKKQFISTISRFASMGRSRGLIVWVGSNAVGLRQNGMEKSGRDYFHRCYLATQRNIATIVGHSSFEGAEPPADVWAGSGRAAYLSTLQQWLSVPKEYDHAIAELPRVAPPPTLGQGLFAGHEGAVGSRELAEQIAYQLTQSGQRSGRLLDLLAGTQFAGCNGDRLETAVIPALKRHTSLITVIRQQGAWVCALPDTADSSSVLDDFLGLF